MRRDAAAAIVAHARAETPFECCGLLIGRGDLVEESVAVANLRRTPTSFLVDPAGHFAAIRKARAEGRSVVGAYHSHPTSAPVPSSTDIRDAHDPELLHVIVSLAAPEPELRAYRIDRNGSVMAICLSMVDG